MSIIIENEYEGEINIPYEKIAHEVIEAAIDYVDCPYECEVNLMLTDNETIHAINKEQREIDRPTDVLSFPMAEYDFIKMEKKLAKYLDEDRYAHTMGVMSVSYTHLVLSCVPMQQMHPRKSFCGSWNILNHCTEK